MSRTSMPSRAISVLLAFVLTCTMIPATAFAASADSSDTAAEAPASSGAESADQPASEEAPDTAAPSEGDQAADRVNQDVPVATQTAPDQIPAEPAAQPAPAKTASDDVDVLSTSVSLSTSGTLLTSGGLAYTLNDDQATVAVTDWVGTAPTGALNIPSQVTIGSATYKVTAVNTTWGGGFRS